MEYSPSSLVTVVRATPVLTLVAVTVIEVGLVVTLLSAIELWKEHSPQVKA